MRDETRVLDRPSIGRFADRDICSSSVDTTELPARQTLDHTDSPSECRNQFRYENEELASE